MSRIITCAALFALPFLIWPTLASAANPKAERAGRGMAAMVAPFVEIPGNIVHTSRHEGPARGWTEGFARGLGMAFIRPPIGLYELVTAPFSGMADDPPVLEPEYPWSYFQDGHHRDSVAHRPDYQASNRQDHQDW